MIRELLSRRTVLTAAATAGVGMSTACSNEGRGGIPVEFANAPVQLPEFIPYSGAEPDLPGDPETGLMDGYFSFPSSPPSTISQPPGDGKTVTSLVRTDSPVPPNLSRNAFWQELNVRLGSDIELNIVPNPDWEQKFATTVAGDVLPELFLIAGSTPLLPQFLEASAADLTPHLAGDAARDYPFLANIPTVTWHETAYNGKIMGIPIPRGVMSTQILYKRTDLLEKLGISEEPQSFDEFLELCTELTRPQENIWALGAVPLDLIRQMLGISNNWREKDGELVRSIEEPEQEAALEAARRMVDAGVLSPDAFASQNNDRKNWFVSGRNYLMMDTFSAWPNFEQMHGMGDEFVMEAMRTPGFDGDPSQACAWLGNPTYGVSAIRKDAEDRVPTLLRVLNYLAAPFGTEEYLFRVYGQEGVHYELEGNDPVLNDRGKSETPLGFRYLTDAPWPIYVPGNRGSTQRWYDGQRIAVDYGLSDPALGLYSETDAREGATIGGRVDDLTNDILQGRKPVSAWADGVTAWRNAGGDRIRAELEQARADRADT